MIRGKFLSTNVVSKKEGFLVFIFLLLSIKVINWFLGAPLYSPDSRAYQLMSQDPLSHIRDWHPVAFPTLVHFLRYLRIFNLDSINIIGAGLNFSIFLVLRKILAPSRALIILFLIIFPNWIMLEAAFWTEALMMLLFFMMILVLTSDLNWKIRLNVSVLLMATSLQTRHAAIFLVPGYFLICLATLNNQFFLIKRIVLCGSISFLLVFIFKQFNGSSLPTQNMMCQQFIVSLNPIPYCDSMPNNIRLCAMDPKHQFIGVGHEQNNEEFTALHFATDSLLAQFVGQYGQAEMCTELKSIISQVAKNHSITWFNLMASRVFNQFGSWDESEFPRADRNEKIHKIGHDLFDDIVDFFNPAMEVYKFGLLMYFGHLCYLGFTYFRNRSFYNGQIFKSVDSDQLLGLALCFTGICHAVGISVNNPFLVLRYQAVSQLLLQMGLILIYYPQKWRRTSEAPGRPDSSSRS